MLKFNELTLEDQQRRYKFVINTLFFLLGTFTYMSGLPMLWLGMAIIASLIFDLYLFGVQKREDYGHSSLVIDSLLLIAINSLSSLVFVPLIEERLNTHTSLGEIHIYLLSALALIALIYGLWELLIFTQNNLTEESLAWKRKKTGFFSSTKTKFE